MADVDVKALVSWCGNHTKADEKRPRIGKARAAATPPAFAEELLRIARTVESMGHRERDATPPPFRDELIAIARSVR